uniref:(northern house mosquito) hypothetical protein n=1 Tax=Culex pipiens TaxID=7175 RepID=A0A8D8FAN7_CULPI
MTRTTLQRRVRFEARNVDGQNCRSNLCYDACSAAQNGSTTTAGYSRFCDYTKHLLSHLDSQVERAGPSADAFESEPGWAGIESEITPTTTPLATVLRSRRTSLRYWQRPTIWFPRLPRPRTPSRK